ncbi:putative voltage-gated K channel beta subunit [Calycina marina]|uniref:Voltage-gated K channel beta subunit n=1 Tax=Calycina marina TaxID=1763456 RepID=A0A9P7Z7P5_9HELO|nr:putative voltage-gated K channel beta subunit [Calycina marina]
MQISSLQVSAISLENTFDSMKTAYDVGMSLFDWAKDDSEKIMAAIGEREAKKVGLSRKHIVEGVNAWLRRLDLEYVDLIYAHRPDHNPRIEDTSREFKHIIYQGKAAEQPQYNMLTRAKVHHIHTARLDDDDDAWNKDIDVVKNLKPVAERLGIEQATLLERLYENVKAVVVKELLTPGIME